MCHHLRTVSLLAVTTLAVTGCARSAWMDPNGSVNVESLGAVQHYDFERGDMETDVPMDQIVDTNFTDHAVPQWRRYSTP